MPSASALRKSGPTGWPEPLHAMWRRLTAGPAPAHAPVTLQLALQGGGAHGAFTWGVLDRLLRDPSLSFDAISGSSAGAMNAVVMAAGWQQGGRSGARQALDRFWTTVGEQLPAELAELLGLSMPGGTSMGALMRQMLSTLTPQQVNPLDHNPLRDILVDQIDFDGLRRGSPFALYIAATQVRTGRLRLFREHELTVDHLLASACLPTLHHTISIDGEAYWDGGLSANPALFPLIREGHSPDVLMVLLTPPEDEVAIDSRRDIDVRLTSLAFSTHLMRELQMIDLLQRQARHVRWPSRQERLLRDLRLHWIDVRDAEPLREHETKLLAYGPFLQQLRELGEAHAHRWLQQHRGALGQRGTFDLSALG